MPSLTFLGAANTVTGSCHLLNIKGKNYLFDCGQFQGPWHIEKRNYEPVGIDAHNVDAIFLSHGHLDHCGRIPLLVNQGFSKDIYCTPPTKDIAMLIMMDSAHLLKEEFVWKRKKYARLGISPKEPLYSSDDVWHCHELFSRVVEYGDKIQVDNDITLSLHAVDAGHVLGSCQIYLEYRPRKGRPITILYSGDIGDGQRPIVDNPAPPEKGVDVLIMESTYGDREHKAYSASVDEFREAVVSTVERGGTVLIPTFALERAQEILFHLEVMKNKGLISEEIPVFLNSPLAINLTRVFEKHYKYCDSSLKDMINKGLSPFMFPGLQFTDTVEESKMIHSVPSPKIILAGSGMITGGRIKHHLKHNLWKEDATVIIVGYQAKNTLGRKLIEGDETVKIFGEEIAVRAKIVTINGFSAHAGRKHLIKYAQEANPRHLFLVHGEPETLKRLKRSIKGVLPRTEVIIPDFKGQYPI